MRTGKSAAGDFILAGTTHAFGDGGGAARLSELAGEVPAADMARLRENASYHELEPLLHLVSLDCAESGHPLPLPRELLESWEMVYGRELARTAVIQHGARAALSALAEAGVRVIPLKGVFLASRYYRRGGARSYRDLDLLVEEDSLAALDEALLEAGFRPHPGRPSFVPAPAYTVYYLPIEDSDLAMEIDIHVGLHWPHEYYGRTAFRSGDLWREASRDTIEDLPVWSMRPEHLVITTMLDAAVNHRYARLIKFRDLVEILARESVDWEVLKACCRAWEVRSFVGPGLALLGRMHPPSLAGAGGLGDLMPSYPLMRLFERSLGARDLPDHRSRSYAPANLIFFLLADGPASRASGLVHLPRHMLKGLRRF